MLLDRRRTKFWQKIVFAFMAFLMGGFLVVGYSGALSSCQNTSGRSSKNPFNGQVKAADAALKVDPTSPQTQLAAAEAYQSRGLAEQDGTPAQAQDLNQALSYYATYLANKDARLGTTPQQAKQARISALTAVVVINSKLGAAAAVVAAYNKMSDLEPKNVDYYLQLGNWSLQAGNNTLAYLSYQKYLQLQPKSEYAPLVKQRLKQIEAQIAAQNKATPTPAPSATK